MTSAIKGSAYKGLLFSEGLDTSILAAIKLKVIGITVSLESEGEDTHYTRLLAKQLDIMIWQGKRPLEHGSGMSRLRRVISERVSDEEFIGDIRSVRFINKEHLYYFFLQGHAKQGC